MIVGYSSVFYRKFKSWLRILVVAFLVMFQILMAFAWMRSAYNLDCFTFALGNAKRGAFFVSGNNRIAAVFNVEGSRLWETLPIVESGDYVNGILSSTYLQDDSDYKWIMVNGRGFAGICWPKHKLAIGAPYWFVQFLFCFANVPLIIMFWNAYHSKLSRKRE